MCTTVKVCHLKQAVLSECWFSSCYYVKRRCRLSSPMLAFILGYEALLLHQPSPEIKPQNTKLRIKIRDCTSEDYIFL